MFFFLSVVCLCCLLFFECFCFGIYLAFEVVGVGFSLRGLELVCWFLIVL